jgi:hypothetical protein
LLFQAEREQRYLLKKEMDLKLNSESMYNLGNLALSIHGRGVGLGGPDVEEEDDMVCVYSWFNNFLFFLLFFAIGLTPTEQFIGQI